MKTIPNYHPPSDYRRPTKTQEKVYVPVNDYPEINFSMLTNPLTLLRALLFLAVCRLPSTSMAIGSRNALLLTELTTYTSALNPKDSND